MSSQKSPISSGEKKKDRKRRRISKVTSPSKDAKASKQPKDYFRIVHTARLLEDLQNKQRSTAKKTATTKNTENSQEDRVSDQTSNSARILSKRAKQRESSRKYARKYFLDMEAACSDSECTSDQSEKDRLSSGSCGGKQEQEKHEECGNSPMCGNSGFTQDKDGSTDTMDTKQSSSTISTDHGSN